MDQIRITKRHRLSKKEKRLLGSKIAEKYPSFKSELEDVEIAFTSTGEKIYIIDGEPVFAETSKGFIPLLPHLLRKGYEWLPSIEVDRGASIAVGKGADLMIPGIVSIRGAFSENDIVAVVDEVAKAPVAVGKALLGSDELAVKVKEKSRGRAVKNLHRPGDRLWSLALMLARRKK
ncbi:MAG: DUF1947 domain-containing protein [Desulfurococcales archaeon]|nr:DUF1947 domain-containing protein [Desulfurococcales archaeon]